MTEIQPLISDTPLKEPAKCPVCACSVFSGDEDDPVIECPRCQAPHHLDCWKYNGGCAIFGCKEQAPPGLVEIESWPTVLQDYHEWLALMDQKRRVSVSFTLMALITITLGVFATDLSAGLFFPFLALLPLAITGRWLFQLEKESNKLEDSLEPITGREPFNAMVTARETTRWMEAAKTAVGNVHTGNSFDMTRALVIMILLQFPIIFYLPLLKGLFILGIDLAVLYGIKDLFVSMRKEQSILINRFKQTFSPALLKQNTDKPTEAENDDIPTI